MSIPAQERNDVLKYTYLQSSQRFEDLGDKLHGDLQEGLRVNGYQYMTEIQA